MGDMQNQPTREGRRLLGTAFFVSVIAVLILANVIVNALASSLGWYFYTEPRYEHTIGDASHAVLDGAEESVRVIFCTDEESLESEVSFSLVLHTFRQLEERYDFISVEFVNIYLHPADVAPYRTRTLANGEVVEYSINEQCIILVSGEDESDFRVETMESFFVLDESRTITAYNGEEFAIACLAWVLRDTHPVAGFTMGHGENQADLLAFYTTLVAAGYDVTMMTLDEDIDEGVGLVVVANPRWDLERGAGVVSELDRLAAFLDRGGTLFVSLDPYAKASLSGIRGFLAERGLTATQDVIRDSQNSITTDGFTLVTDYAVNEYATSVSDRIGAFGGSRALVREASAIACDTVGDYTAYPLLTASSSAVCYRNGVVVDSAGGYPVLAVSEAEVAGGTATVILSSSVYFLANDAMNSATYTNRDVVLASLEAATGMSAPVGCTVLPIESTRLEDLTMGTARLYTILVAVVIPLAVASFGVVVTVRRKNR